MVLSLTPKGCDYWDKVMVVIARRNEEILSALTIDEREQLSVLLDRLLQHARQTSLPE